MPAREPLKVLHAALTNQSENERDLFMFRLVYESVAAETSQTVQRLVDIFKLCFRPNDVVCVALLSLSLACIIAVFVAPSPSLSTCLLSRDRLTQRSNGGKCRRSSTIEKGGKYSVIQSAVGVNKNIALHAVLSLYLEQWLSQIFLRGSSTLKSSQAAALALVSVAK